MSYTLVVARKAEKYLDRLMKGNPSAVAAIFAAMDGLTLNPKPVGSKKLEGKTKGYRIKVKDHRILYRVNNEEIIVDVFRIGHRREVYKDLK